MTPDYWQKIKRILDEALAQPTTGRDAYLASACGANGTLRRDVESLLAFENTDGDALEAPAFAVVENLQTQEKNFVGETFGNYKILEKIGEGGMGAVFLAERDDGEFRQRVAVKLIRSGISSETVLRRFLNERQILAGLEHPNIARLIDGGTSQEGVPFLVMEYVEGVPIDDYANQKNLSLNERLDLFRRVAAAVAHAHKNLVIHRDLKPSNILVDASGEPKLLDFGIAKLLKTDDDSNETQTRQFAFTPDYASPEQVRGEKLTTATDVYSLGVILYELLTGARPYQTDSRNIGEVIRIVCETEPERPSSIVLRPLSSLIKPLTDDTKATAENEERETKNQQPATKSQKPKSENQRALRGDLDNIILKALRKEPERRYSSIEQFSEDIRRHQFGLPVTASADTWTYRAAKFAQRNRVGVAAAGLILLTLLGGLATTLYQANAARRERQKAEQRFADVRSLANSFLFEFHDAIENLPGSTAARELVVKRAVEYLDKLAAESGNDATLQRELGTAYAEVGEIQGNSYHANLGDTDGAMKSYRRSLEIRQRLSDADPNNRELLHELADSHEGIGDMLYTINNLESGLQSYETAAAIRERIVASEPENLEYRYSLANILGKLGDIKGMEGFPNLGDTPGALASYRRVVPLYEKLVEAAPDSEKYKKGYATALHYYGMLQTATGDAKGAIAGGQKSIAIFDALIAANPNNAQYETHLMSALVFMRYPLLDEGRTTEAIENARRVVRSMEKSVADDPKNAFARRSLSVSYNSLGKCLLQAGDAAGAIENHRRSLAIVEELANAESAETSRDVSLTKQFLAEAQMAAGDSEAALQNLRQSVASLEAELKIGTSNIQIKDDLVVCLVNVGKILAARGDADGATDAFRRAVPLAEEMLQKNSFNVRFKSRHAASFQEAGKAFAKLAQTESGEKREQMKNESCQYSKRSFEIWDEMRQAGTLSAIYANRPDEVSQAINSCQ